MTKTLTHARKRLLRWWIAPLLGLALIAGIETTGAPKASGVSVPATGIVCSHPDSNNVFKLTARDGQISTPDDNLVYMWSFAPTGGGFQYPGPVLCLNQGQTVTIVLKNTLPEDTSIVFPGQDNVTSSGVPVSPVYQGGNLVSLAQTAKANGGSVSYTFTAGRPGTYIYESGTDQDKQLDMGLVGALVVRPSMGAAFAYNRSDSAFNPDTEYVMLLSQSDPALHRAVERNQPFDMKAYHARYWFVNGRSFPDTIAPNNAAWLPTQPYSSLVEFQPHSTDPGNPFNKPSLVRYLSTGPVTYPFHPHGNHGRVIARDGQALQGPAGQDLSYEKYTVAVGPGQTADATYTWTDVDGWNPDTKPIPVAIPPLANLLFKDNATWYSGSPYLGYKGPLPVGVTSYNECGEYYFMMHSHALYQITNFGIAGGGMLTLMRVDPPGGC